MKLRDLFTAATPALDTPVQQPGRHSTVGLVERLTREIAALKASRDKEIRGYQDALQQAGRDVEEARQRSNFHLRGWQAADREVKRLQALLDADAGVPGTMPQPAFADRPDFQPLPDAPTPDRDRDQLPPIALTLPRPTTYDVTDVTAETQPVDVAELRDAVGEGDTRTLPVVAVTPVMPLHDAPLPAVTWGRDQPLKAATSVPATAASDAVTKVHATVTEGATL